MPTTVTCPSCGRALSLPEDAGGRKVQCPTCGTAFDAAPVLTVGSGIGEAVPSIPNLPPPPRPLVPVLVDSSSVPMREPAEPDEVERCPMCKRPVRADMEICPACGTDLESRADEDGGLRGPPRRDYEPHRAALISVMGTASILFGVIAALALCAGPFAVAGVIGAGTAGAALVMARDDLDQMERNIMDPDGRRQTLSGQTNATIGLIVSLIGILAGGLRVLVYFANMP